VEEKGRIAVTRKNLNKQKKAAWMMLCFRCKRDMGHRAYVQVKVSQKLRML